MHQRSFPSRRSPITLAGLVALATLAGPATPARGNGDNSHDWISLQAIEHLPEGRLKELLRDPELQLLLLDGSIFPDGGYVIEDDYGEMAHWEPFVDAYRRWITERFDPPYTRGEAVRHVAYLFGIASHGMADQVFDSQFVKMAEVYDAENWGEGLIDGFDTASDVILVAETGLDLEWDPYVPADDLSALYADRLDYSVDAYTLETAQDMLHRMVLAYPRDTGLDQPGKVQDYRDQYPWGSANLMDPMVPGSPPCEAVAVAAYWQSMWFRLQGQNGPDLVVATVPGDGGLGQPTDHSLIESEVVIVFGQGMDPSTLGPGSVTVAAGGVDHPIEVDLWHGPDTNIVRLLPQADWAADTDYTVTLHPGIAAEDGEALTEPIQFTFSTRAAGADAPPPCTDPTPFLGEPEIAEPSGSGCTVAPGRAGRAALPWLLAGLLFAIGRRRHRRRAG